MSEVLVSVYTCVYNRADKIHRVFDSLKTQTYKNLEHIVVDDGSTDNITELLEKYKKEVSFPVVIIKKTNGGKHTATNVAWDNCHGDFVVQLDSDDELLPDAIQNLVNLTKKVPESQQKNYWCFLARCKTQFSDEMIGKAYPENINTFSHSKALKIESETGGEKIGLLNFKILKNFRFPEPQGVTFVPEGVLWAELDRKFRTYYSNIIVRKYYVAEGDNLSHPKLSRQMITNKLYSCRCQIENNISFFNTVKCTFAYSMAYFVSNKKFRKNNSYFIRKNSFFILFLQLLLLFPSYLFHFILLLIVNQF